MNKCSRKWALAQGTSVQHFEHFRRCFYWSLPGAWCLFASLFFPLPTPGSCPAALLVPFRPNAYPLRAFLLFILGFRPR